MEDDGVDVMQFAPCHVCGRTFRPDVLERHSRICSQVKANEMKRNAFKSSKQRPTPIHSSKPPSTPLKQPPSTNRQEAPLPAAGSKKTGNWRQKHLEFVSTIRAAREVTRALKTGGPLPPPPPPAENPDYVQCPHCMRRFNEEAAKRHMPFCKEQSARVRKAPTKDASDKLSRRMQYRPPALRNRANSVTSATNFLVSPSSSTATASSRSNKGGPPSTMHTSMANGPLPPSTQKPPKQRPMIRGSSTYSAASRTSSSRTSSTNRIAGNVSRDGVPIGQSNAFHQRNRVNNGVANSLTFTSDRGGVNQWVQEGARTSRGSSISDSSTSETRSLTSRSSGVHSSHQMSPMPPARPRDLGTQSRQSHQRPLNRQSAVPSTSQSEFAYRPKTSAVSGDSLFQSKFCYECGTKYPVPHAKYCCECGTKRI